MTPEERINFYLEPVEIEIYLKKAGKVKTVVKDLYIELIDPVPEKEMTIRIFDFFRSQNLPIDLIEITNNFPELIMAVQDSYFSYLSLYEKLSMHFQNGISGASDDAWKLCLYFTELLMKYEPTMASLTYLGDFHTFNLNYLIRKLNTLHKQFLLEDTTVSYLIKRHMKLHEEEPRDYEFEKLVELWHYNVYEKSI